jgi:hypothetical protein
MERHSIFNSNWQNARTRGLLCFVSYNTHCVRPDMHGHVFVSRSLRRNTNGACVGRSILNPGRSFGGAGAESGKSFGGGKRAFAAPFVVFAQLGLVFLNLGFQFAEGFLTAGSQGGSCAGGVQRSGGQR